MHLGLERRERFVPGRISGPDWNPIPQFPRKKEKSEKKRFNSRVSGELFFPGLWHRTPPAMHKSPGDFSQIETEEKSASRIRSPFFYRPWNGKLEQREISSFPLEKHWISRIEEEKSTWENNVPCSFFWEKEEVLYVDFFVGVNFPIYTHPQIIFWDEKIPPFLPFSRDIIFCPQGTVGGIQKIGQERGGGRRWEYDTQRLWQNWVDLFWGGWSHFLSTKSFCDP